MQQTQLLAVVCHYQLMSVTCNKHNLQATASESSTARYLYLRTQNGPRWRVELCAEVWNEYERQVPEK